MIVDKLDIHRLTCNREIIIRKLTSGNWIQDNPMCSVNHSSFKKAHSTCTVNQVRWSRAVDRDIRYELTEKSWLTKHEPRKNHWFYWTSYKVTAINWMSNQHAWKTDTLQRQRVSRVWYVPQFLKPKKKKWMSIAPSQDRKEPSSSVCWTDDCKWINFYTFGMETNARKTLPNKNRKIITNKQAADANRRSRWWMGRCRPHTYYTHYSRSSKRKRWLKTVMQTPISSSESVSIRNLTTPVQHLHICMMSWLLTKQRLRKTLCDPLCIAKWRTVRLFTVVGLTVPLCVLTSRSNEQPKSFLKKTKKP